MYTLDPILKRDFWTPEQFWWRSWLLPIAFLGEAVEKRSVSANDEKKVQVFVILYL